MFKSSITIMKVSGIPIRLHVSFLLILPFIAYVIASNIAGIAEMASVNVGDLALQPFTLGLLLAMLLFVSVALHELSHSLVARSQGMEIQDITLMLLGGVAQIEDGGMERDEMWMAFAGPLFSLVFGAVLLFLIRPLTMGLGADLALVVYYLGFMNIFLAVFNMIPAFPSDGGRILRSFLARRTSYLEATRIATAIGKGFAVAFALFGFLIGNIILILIAFFIYIGATQEYQANVVKDVFSEFKVSDLMTENVATVEIDSTVAELLERMLHDRHSGYPVVDESGAVVGCVTLGDIRSLPQDVHETARIDEIMSREVISVAPWDDLFSALQKISEADIGRLIVMEDGELVGILTRSDIMKAYRLKAMREERRRIEA